MIVIIVTLQDFQTCCLFNIIIITWLISCINCNHSRFRSIFIVYIPRINRLVIYCMIWLCPFLEILLKLSKANKSASIILVVIWRVLILAKSCLWSSHSGVRIVDDYHTWCIILSIVALHHWWLVLIPIVLRWSPLSCFGGCIQKQVIFILLLSLDLRENSHGRGCKFAIFVPIFDTNTSFVVV